jgi:tRNA A-37 threonylcarbamoyl transferase component Bud32
VTSGPSPAEREKLRQEIKALGEEREKLSAQGDEPYSEDGNDDQIAKRLVDIEKRLREAERKLTPPQ